jgi:hypothetical protein
MHLALYAHPFDLDALGSHGGLSRLADLGFREIVMATSYHDGRWLQPWHPDTRVRFLEDGTVHFRPGTDYGVLRPQASTSVPAQGLSPLQRLCADAPKAGLTVRAWNVCTHNSRLGLLHPELCVENAFGDRYTYALCPAQPAVQQYVLGLSRDLAAHDGLGAIEFEAFGWMGFKHSSHHDKSSFTARGVLDYALSLCFCAACTRRLVAAGGDPERTRSWAKAVCQLSVGAADAMAPPALSEYGTEADTDAENLIWHARSARIGIVADLSRDLAAVLPAKVARAVQVHPSRWFVGSQLPVDQAAGLGADEHVVTAYGEAPAAIAALWSDVAMQVLAGRGQRLSIWPKAPQFTTDEDLVRVRELAAAHGIGAIAIYHLGLLPWRTIERVARVLTG